MISAAGSAVAQSSVTLYGILDEGVNYVNNVQTAKPGAPNGRTGASQWLMSSSVQQGSRWGLRGSEDLGDGNKAIFLMENGFDVGTGKLQQGGLLFGRQVYFGVGSSKWGTVTLGRQYDSIVDVMGATSAAVYVGGAMANHPGDVDNVADTIRINNAVKYTSPVMHGLMVTGLYSFGGAAGAFGRNSIYSVGARYDFTSLSMSAGYMHINNPNQSFWGNMATSSPTANNLGSVTGVQANPIFGGFASARTLAIIAAASQYTAGSLILGVGYSHTSFNDLNYSESGPLNVTNPFGYKGNAVFNNYSVYGAYYITPTLELGAAYDYLRGGGIDGKDSAAYQLINLCIDYFLSKRTDVYFSAAYERASGVDSTKQSAVPFVSTFIPSNTSNQVLARIGLRHKF
jgi:predicted porin